MQAATIKRAKRTAARLAADTELQAALATFSATYQGGLAAVRAGTMTSAQFGRLVNDARRVRDAAGRG